MVSLEKIPCCSFLVIFRSFWFFLQNFAISSTIINPNQQGSPPQVSTGCMQFHSTFQKTGWLQADLSLLKSQGKFNSNSNSADTAQSLQTLQLSNVKTTKNLSTEITLIRQR